MDGDQNDKKKPHRERHSGRKAEKKKTKKEHVQEQTDKQRNPKAFTFNSAVRAERRFRRTQDIQTKKQHVPVVDRTPLEPPPIMVAVVGPPKVGKSTLIQCLVKNFTRQPLTAIKGPVTVVSGKKRRITLMECNNDINSMIDLAKVADLVLLLIDASFGFEMEIFEFLNICQVHGMPRVMGVLTHLDMLKQAKTLKRTKKVLKHRFWTEVYAGAKLFYLSGLLHGEYLRNEVKNLGRFISVMKFRPLTWQTTHSYLVADRMEDLTPPELIRQNPKVDRTVSLYGFVRGIPLNKASSVHIPGCGDSVISDVCFLPDPCPLPDKLKKRSLVDKERLIYAPFSGVGGIVYDKDAVYIELAGSHSHHNEMGGRDESERELVSSLLETKDTLDAKIAKSQLQIFSNTTPITAEEFQRDSEKTMERSERKISISTASDGRNRRKVIFGSDDNDSGLKSEESDVSDSDQEEDTEIKSDEDEDEVNNEEDEENSIGDESEQENSDEDSEMSDSEEIVNIKKTKVRSKRSKLIKSTSGLSAKSNKNKKHLSKNNRRRSGDEVEEMEDISHQLKGKKRIASEATENSSHNESDEDLDNFMNKKKKSSNEREDVITARYHATQSDKDKEIRNKISDALEKLKYPNKRNHPAGSSYNAVTDDESSDSLNDDLQSAGSDEESSKEEDNSNMNSDLEDSDQGGNMSVNEESSSVSSEDDENESSAVNWKANLAQKAADAFVERQNSTANLWKLVYGQDVSEKANEESDADEEEVAGLFKVIGKKQDQKMKEKDTLNALDTSKFVVSQVRDWSLEQAREMIKDCFVTGKWKSSEDASELLRLDDVSDTNTDEDMFGDFEDLETGQKHQGKTKQKQIDESEEDDKDNENEGIKEEKPLTKAELIEKKKKLKEKFDAEYDEKDGEENTFYDGLKKEASMQAELNRSQFEGLDDAVRVQLEGFRAGMYVRLELQQMPCELVQHFDPTYPLIVGVLQPGEENVGYLKVRIKKHRWYKKILKTRDPLIISMGWRRFQTLAVYSKLEDNLRHRMLKYTPEHVVCMAHFWGPITRPNTGFLAVQDVASKQTGFRIVATGSVVDCNKSTDVTKKLKLTGVPLKIYKKTAFIKGMFNSSLEVAKFEGARIKTVSGIRGIIKKAVNKPEGAFRATFEDKIQLSDIVFCRMWYGVDIPKLYNPVTSLLLPPDQKNLWQGMKTVGQLKREKGLHSEPQKDSLYTPIVREPVAFKPLIIPKKLQKNLPYKDKPKVIALQKKKEKVAVVRDIHESKVASMMKKLKTIYNEKREEERRAKVKRLKDFKRKIETEEARKLQRQRKMKKDVFRTLSKTESKKTQF
uniref:Bms1-type G domain-containing protein n=1 Tax=Cuerna arida TaxID=1464854 RepID=A0A1B6G6J2_9HEMI